MTPHFGERPLFTPLSMTCTISITLPSAIKQFCGRPQNKAKQRKGVDIMTVSNIVDQYTIMSGDRSKIKDLLCNRLTECGWRDEVRLLCRNILIDKNSNSSVTVEQLIAEVTPKARTMVPDPVKKELLMKIRSILSESENDIIN